MRRRDERERSRESYILLSLVVLAAGLSKRYGANKLLEHLNEATVIRRVVSEALNSEADEVIVVLGHDAERVRGELKGLACKLVYNERYTEGQSSSVKAGVAYTKEHAEATLILPADIALITSDAINKVVDGYRRSGSVIVVASHRGRDGHPILFDKSLYEEIMQTDEETYGLKAVVNRHKMKISRVEAGSDAVLLDFDSPEDFQRRILGVGGK